MDWDGSQVEITYLNPFMDIPETTFDINMSEKDIERLQNAEDDGEFLDQDYISENKPGIHKKILRAIRKNMREVSLYEPDDGMVERRLPWGSTTKDFDFDKTHEWMDISSEDDDIEYSVTIY